MRLLRWLGISVLLPLLALVLPHGAGGGTITVTMGGYAFAPATLTIAVGDTVTWTNTDVAPHDVTTTSAPQALKSPTLHKGDSWSHTFSVPGTYEYICSIHPDMHATVVVKAPAQPTASAAPTTTHHAAAAAADPPHSAAAAPASSPTTPQATRAKVLPARPTPTVTVTVPAVATQAMPAQVAPTANLRPLLLVAGLVTSVAVLCLLLMATRTSGSSS